jgi:hypothetical protein
MALKKISSSKGTRLEKKSPSSSEPAPLKKQRKCSRCGKLGHRASTCKTELNPDIEIDTKPVSKESAAGHKLLEEQRQKVERQEINGQIPEKGLWIVSYIRQKIAGKIILIKRDGKVVWKSSIGATISTPQEWFANEGYCYIKDLEPEMLRWYVI